jgi:hypothetical protein
VKVTPGATVAVDGTLGEVGKEVVFTKVIWRRMVVSFMLARILMAPAWWDGPALDRRLRVQKSVAGHAPHEGQAQLTQVRVTDIEG